MSVAITKIAPTPKEYNLSIIVLREKAVIAARDRLYVFKVTITLRRVLSFNMTLIKNS